MAEIKGFLITDIAQIGKSDDGKHVHATFRRSGDGAPTTLIFPAETAEELVHKLNRVLVVTKTSHPLAVGEETSVMTLTTTDQLKLRLELGPQQMRELGRAADAAAQARHTKSKRS